MRKPRLFGLGGAHIDRRGVMQANYIYGASIPGQMIEETGGGVFNALRVATQFYVDCSLLSVRGGDAAGEIVAQEAKRAGITDLSSVFLDRTTASYTALLTQEGDVVAALADMSIYESALPRQIARRQTREAIAASDAVLIDANMPEAAITRLIERCADKPVFALAISPAKAVRLRPVLEKLSCLFLNQREARAILGIDDGAAPTLGTELAMALTQRGVARFVMTNGADAVCVADNDRVITLSPPKARSVVDVTGAGDALTGATIAALLNNVAFADAVCHGLAAAAITVESAQACADFSDKSQMAALLAQMKP
jgi:sugar/nucleoside kinase (ribokinase family)